MGIILKKTEDQELVKTEVGKIKVDDIDIKAAENSDLNDQEVSKKELIIAVLVVIVLLSIVGLIFWLNK